MAPTSEINLIVSGRCSMWYNIPTNQGLNSPSLSLCLCLSVSVPFSLHPSLHFSGEARPDVHLCGEWQWRALQPPLLIHPTQLWQMLRPRGGHCAGLPDPSHQQHQKQAYQVCLGGGRSGFSVQRGHSTGMSGPPVPLCLVMYSQSECRS